MMFTRVVHTAGIVAGCLLAPTLVTAQPYVVRSVASLPDGTPLLPYSITDRGEVIGYIPEDSRRMWGPGFAILPRPIHGLDAGLHINSPTPTPQPHCTGVNLSRQWVGSTTIRVTPGSIWWRRASIVMGSNEERLLEPVGDVGDNVAHDINENDETVGVAADGTNDAAIHYVAVQWDARGHASVLPAPKGFGSAVAYGLNDEGWAVGSVAPAGDNPGSVSGYYFDRKYLPEGRRAVLWIDGRASMLTDHVVAAPNGFVLERARDVSNMRWIVGDGVDTKGTPVGVVLVPAGADLNGDDRVDAADIEMFSALYQAASVAADYTADGILDATDVAEFMALHLAGVGVGGSSRVLTEREQHQADLWLNRVNTPGVPSPPVERGVFDDCTITNRNTAGGNATYQAPGGRGGDGGDGGRGNFGDTSSPPNGTRRNGGTGGRGGNGQGFAQPGGADGEGGETNGSDGAAGTPG